MIPPVVSMSGPGEVWAAEKKKKKSELLQTGSSCKPVFGMYPMLMGPPKTINQSINQSINHQSSIINRSNRAKMSKVNSSVNSRFWKLSFGRRNTLSMRNMFWPCTTSLCGQFDTKITWLSIKSVSKSVFKRVSLKRIKYESCRSQEGAEKTWA